MCVCHARPTIYVLPSTHPSIPHLAHELGRLSRVREGRKGAGKLNPPSVAAFRDHVVNCAGGPPNGIDLWNTDFGTRSDFYPVVACLKCNETFRRKNDGTVPKHNNCSK